MTYSYDEFLRQLGKRLRHMRDERGWTVRYLMLTHGFHLAQWQGFENGTGISVPTLLRLCAVFDVTLEQLIGGIGQTEAEKAFPAPGKAKRQSAATSDPQT